MPSTLDDFEILYKIASGSYGTCKKIRRKRDGKVLVWKEMDYGEMSEAEKQMLVSEVNLLRELKHQHIVRYYDRIIDRSNTKIYIIMEYCEGGDMASLIKRCAKEGRFLDEDFVWKIFAQVVQALHECHSRTRTKKGKAILHRDLKPANVFLDARNNVKLGDFGLARVLTHETSFAKTFVGTPYYMSPEQMNYMSYNEKSDIWSLGCLMYEICSLRPPFTAGDRFALATRIRMGRFSRIPHRYSDDLSELINTMLQVDEHKRPGIDVLVEHAGLIKHMSRPEHRPSTSDSGSSVGSNDSLKKREDNLKARETVLDSREKELDNREKVLAAREKLAEEMLAKAERALKEVKLKSEGISSTDLYAEDLDELPSPLRSCLTRKKKEDSPKKHVTFNASEQNGEVQPYHRNSLDEVRTNLDMKFDFFGESIPTKGNDVYQSDEIISKYTDNKVTEYPVKTVDRFAYDGIRNGLLDAGDRFGHVDKPKDDIISRINDVLYEGDNRLLNGASDLETNFKPKDRKYSDVLSTITNNYEPKYGKLYDKYVAHLNSKNDYGLDRYSALDHKYPVTGILSKYNTGYTNKYDSDVTNKYITDYETKYTSYNRFTDNLNTKYTSEIDKKKDLRERWTRAQKRSEELRRAEEESRYKTKQLLAMR